MTSDWAYLVSALFYLLHPIFNGVEGLFVSDVIDDDDSVGAVIVIAGYGLEAFLAGRVPLISQRSADERTFR